MPLQMATVKEGWINKRGEYVQNLRPRYFVLKSDGTFRGYKQPPLDSDLPINIFEVANSSIHQVMQLLSYRYFITFINHQQCCHQQSIIFES
jgi:hypothetical protein